MTNSSQAQPSKRGHLNLAADFAADAWFPGNRGVAEAAEALIASSDAGFDREKFVATVRSDFSLLTFTSLHLARSTGAAPRADLLDHAPLDLIRIASPTDLGAILRQAKGRCGPSPADASAGENGARVKHAIVSASSAEIIAHATGIDPETAYACALFRQLGNTLIAWNYPHVYRRALTLVRSDAPLDLILGKILGFTPSLLGLTIAQRWNITPVILRGMGDQTAYSRVKESALSAGDRLNEICTLSESIAQSTEPGAYPAAVRRWPEIRATFERLAGPAALDRLRDTLAYNARVYLSVVPPVFHLPPELVETPAKPAVVSSRFEGNSFAHRCPEPIRHLFRDLYAGLEGGQRARALTALLRSVAPTVGFKGGCVFIHEIESDLLRPRYTAGNLRPIDYPTFRIGTSNDDPVTVSFLRADSTDPIHDDGAITGAIGETRRTGVVKMLPGPELRALNADELDLLFRAFRKALEDCLEAY